VVEVAKAYAGPIYYLTGREKMGKGAWLLTALLVALFPTGVFAQKNTAQSAPSEAARGNPFDTTAARQTLGESLATVATVEQLEKTALQLTEIGNCKAAVSALDKYAREANSLANLIAQGLQPYYGAPYDERRSFGGVGELIPMERLSNSYKTKRNRALVMQAECLAKLGDSRGAVVMYYQALGLIAIDDDWWPRARQGLYRLIQVSGKAP
jgi:hypothetical protein